MRPRAATVCKIPLSNAPRLQAILFIQPVDVQFLLAIDLSIATRTWGMIADSARNHCHAK